MCIFIAVVVKHLLHIGMPTAIYNSSYNALARHRHVAVKHLHIISIGIGCHVGMPVTMPTVRTRVLNLARGYFLNNVVRLSNGRGPLLPKPRRPIVRGLPLV